MLLFKKHLNVPHSADMLKGRPSKTYYNYVYELVFVKANIYDNRLSNHYVIFTTAESKDCTLYSRDHIFCLRSCQRFGHFTT